MQGPLRVIQRVKLEKGAKLVTESERREIEEWYVSGKSCYKDAEWRERDRK